MSSSKLILPRIHLGGTGPATLIADYSAARVALSDALRLLGESYHDRDYYLLGETVHRAARGQHIERCGALRRTINDLHALEEHALEERDARDKARAHLTQEAAWVQQCRELEKHETLHLHARAAADAAYADAYNADHR
jgi:hypothetical protein